MEGAASGGEWSTPSGNVSTHAVTAKDPSDGQVAAPHGADHWNALVGDISTSAGPGKDAPPVGAEARGVWASLIGDSPLDPPSAGEATSANSTSPEAGDMWGDLLGDGAPPPSNGRPLPGSEIGDPALHAASAESKPPDTAWDDLLSDTVDLRSATTHQGTASREPAPKPAEPPAGDLWGDLLSDAGGEKPEAGANDRAATAIPAAIASDRVYSAQMPSDAVGALPTDQPGGSKPPAYEAPLRPEHGGWWTLGGARLSPMVWPLAELPPAESFILLLHNQDPETGA
jgi:hypothetical protein